MSFFSLIICGCSQNSTFQKYMQPELLYLKEQPYSQIYVEVDSIEGFEVPDEWIDALKSFLEEHCSKPDGIKIVRDKPIPFNDIKDIPISTASILYTDGPVHNYDSQPAYLHIFFYNKKNIFKKTRKEPHVILHCPSTIFYNVDYGYRLDKLIKLALPHEAGHVLGLCNNKSHSDRLHCTNTQCLMNESPGYFDSLWFLIFGIPPKSELCNDCKNDLIDCSSQTADPNLTFDGPFLIRKEDGYFVASLPYCTFIIPEILEEDILWTELLENLKNEAEKIDYKDYDKEKYI